MREENEEIPKASQEQVPKHQNISRPPGKSYPNTNTHPPTGMSRHAPSVPLPPSRTQSHTRTSFPRTNSETPEYSQAARQELPKHKPKPQHTHVWAGLATSLRS